MCEYEYLYWKVSRTQSDLSSGIAIIYRPGLQEAGLWNVFGTLTLLRIVLTSVPRTFFLFGDKATLLQNVWNKLGTGPLM